LDDLKGPSLNIDARSAYVHVPFCRHRCGYCNFTLVAGRDYLVDRFLAAIETELQPLPPGIELDTLYLGGGTPSRLGNEALIRLKQILDSRFLLRPNAEFTIECNPVDIDLKKIETLSSIGVNRISLGVQSFNARKLKRLERDHSPDVAREAVKLCQSFCQSVSLDLIFATAGETVAEWQADLDAALETGPDHVSTYELTYEKGTTFWNRRQRGELSETDDDIKAEMYAWTIERLATAGLKHYEISSFSKPDHQSRHNNIYWSGRDYFAFGPGASRYLDGVRATNHRSPMAYLKRAEAGENTIVESERLSPRDRALEHLVIGLRMRRGIDVQTFANQNGFDPRELIANVRKELESLGFLTVTSKRIQVTETGVFVCDSIAQKILGSD